MIAKPPKRKKNIVHGRSILRNAPSANKIAG